MKEKNIFGIHAVQEAMDSGVAFNRVFIQKDIHNLRVNGLIKNLKERQIPFQFVPKEKLNRMTSSSHQGIAASISSVDFAELENVVATVYEKGEIPFIVILDSITDVRNLGAIARSAECFGAHALVVPSKGGASFNSESMKASAGALNKIPVCRPVNFLEGIQYLKKSGLKILACSEKANKIISDAELNMPIALIMGSEGEGINPSLMDLCDEHIKIPMTGDISSLNVSVAAGVIFYEVMKNRKN